MKELFVFGAGASHASGRTPLGKNLIWDYFEDCSTMYQMEGGRPAQHDIENKKKEFANFGLFLESIEKKFPNGPEIILPYDKISFEPVELVGLKHINQNVSATLGIAQIRDGQYKTVWPFQVAEVQPLVPLPW